MTGHLFKEPQETTAQNGNATPHNRYARIAVERGIDGWQRGAAVDTLTYSIEDTNVQVGQRVSVPLGRGGELVGGFVVAMGGRELLGSLPPNKAKPIAKVERARLPERLVELGTWIGEYYLCPLGMVLASMVPAAVKAGVGRAREALLVRVSDPSAEAIATLKPASQEAWQVVSKLDAKLFPVRVVDLKLKLGLRTLGAINQLRRAGLLELIERETVRSRLTTSLDAIIGNEPIDAPTLTHQQQEVVDGIRGLSRAASMAGNDTPATRFAVHLLHGVTGSGKTEVYLRLLADALARGRSAIMLVPEISLTPQTAGRLMRRLGGSGVVAVLHSGLTAAQRHAEWDRAASGSAKVVIGARSAVFAPLANLGLVIVDEEHATDYKQDQLPRYHARDVAIKRAQLEGCPIVLGSATPSLESWANATPSAPGQRPRYHLWRLTERPAGGRLPEVRIIDLARERRDLARAGALAHGPAENGDTPRRGFSAMGAIGPTLRAELARTLDAGGQAILLLNRRGFASQICCAKPTCGWVMLCDDCDAAQVWHRSHDLPRGGVLRCHHCLAEKLVPRQCPQCGGRVIHLGIGTQRVEEELLETFPFLANGGLVRADGDSVENAREWFGLLESFQLGKTRVLLGTQMIAKGHDFANVRLVGVINADTALALPDFRAGERTFQLVSQVAGRAGRGAHPGLVIVQTMNPHDPAIVLAGRHDYEAFARQELEIRRRSRLPPVWRMARIVVRDRDFAKAKAMADELAGAIRTAANAHQAWVLGPGPCAIARIAQHHRLGIEVSAPSAIALAHTLGSVRRQGLMRSDATTAIDVDPIAMV